MHIETFHDEETRTFTHIVVDLSTNKCAVIDSVLNYDQDSAQVSTTNADEIIAYIKEHNYTNEWLLETHIHADHITASHYLKQHIGGKQAMGSKICDIFNYWIPKFGIEKDTPNDGSQFDELFDDGDTFKIGNLDVCVWHTPGHTPSCVTYLVGDAIFVGDSMFAPHIGTARCDFPGGSAEQMYKSIQRLYTLPDHTEVYLCHDYPEEGQKPQYKVTIGEAKAQNAQLKPSTEFAEYVKKREARDKTLSTPKLLLPSIQANMRLGDFGTHEKTGYQYAYIPINVFKDA